MNRSYEITPVPCPCSIPRCAQPPQRMFCFVLCSISLLHQKWTLPPAGHLPFSSCVCGLQPIWKCAVANNDWYSLFVCGPCKLNMSGCYRLVSERGEGATALRCLRDTVTDVQPGHWGTVSTAATAGPLMWTPAFSNLWFTHDRQAQGISARYFPSTGSLASNG